MVVARSRAACCNKEKMRKAMSIHYGVTAKFCCSSEKRGYVSFCG